MYCGGYLGTLSADMKRLLLIALLTLASTGCKSYYEVKDLRTDKVYYTRNIDRWKAGAIRFKDANSAYTVTLTTHEFKKIQKADYSTAVTGTTDQATGDSSRGWK